MVKLVNFGQIQLVSVNSVSKNFYSGSSASSAISSAYISLHLIGSIHVYFKPRVPSSSSVLSA